MESPTEEGDLVWWLAIAAVMSLAAALRFQNLAMASLWLDEAFSWSQARLPFWDMIKETAGDGHLPLQNTVLYLTIRAFGDSEGVLRTPSAIYGVVNVAAIYWVGAILGGRGVGIVSAILLTLSGVHIWQSQDVRPYALLTLTSTLYMGATYRALETGRRQWQAASAVAALMLLLSHVYGLFLWLSIVAAVLAARYLWRKSTPHHRAWLFWQCVPAVLFIPWTAALYHRYMQIIAWGFWISKPTPRRIVELVSGLSSGGALAILLLLGTIWGYVTIGRNDERRAWRFSVRLSIDRDRFLLLAWLLGPFLIGFVLSWISQPILVYRYVIGSLPAFFIAASIGLWRLLGHRPLFAICATALAANLTLGFFYIPKRKTDWRDIVATYNALSSPSDCVVLYKDYIARAFDYYARQPPSCLLLPKTVEEFEAASFSSRRVWVFLAYGSNDDFDRVRRDMEKRGWKHPEIENNNLHFVVAEQP